MTDEQHTPCPACFQGFKLNGTPKGTMEKLGGLDYYYSPGKAEQIDKAIVIGVDMFGFGVPNCKIIADWFAEKTGWPVFVPDLLEGDHIDPATLGSNLDDLEEPMAKKPFLTRMSITLGAFWTFGYKIGPRFLARHSMGRVVPLADKFCHDLKKEKGFQRLGYVGYCFGGTVSVFLAKADSAVDSLVCFHPGGPKPAEWANIAKPFLLVLPEEDFAFDRNRSTVLPMLEKLSVQTKVIDDNPGTTHGFGCRPNMAKPQIRQAFERGLEHTKDWFEAHM